MTGQSAAMRHAEILGDEAAPGLLAAALGLKEGETPFPWQTRLLQRMRAGDIPRSLDVPTGLGKTATMAIWLVARALGARVPTRLVYVVDRRAVVDQATDVAANLRSWVAETPSIQEALLPSGGSLPVSTLRGQFVDNREWLEDPSTPAIVVGTIDLVGSRLLFEGYRASRRIRPYMAGLLGQDTLFVLDEAHLVPPFERLLERVVLDDRTLRGSQEDGRPPPPRLLSLSATGRSRGGEPFDLEAEDLAHPIVKQRLGARKRLVLEELGGKADIASVAAERAWGLTSEGTKPLRCVVFLAKREDAEKVVEHLIRLSGLDKLKKGEGPRADIELLVGGRRVFERTQAARRLEELGFLAGTERERRRPAFLVATSAGEVGVDLDADHMVSDLVAWERMVQRLGRVNRRGSGDAQVLVLDVPPSGKDAAPDEARRAAVRELLRRLPEGDSGGRDASPGALRDLQRVARSEASLAGTISRASTPEPLYPPLDRPTLDAWSMTSLAHHPGRPAVAPWLRGWVEARPQTTVIWRRLLPLVNDEPPSPAHAKAFFEAAPLHASELLETESHRVVEWLGKRAKRLLGAVKKGREGSLKARSVVAALLQDGGEKILWKTLEELAEWPKRELDRALPGAELVVDARFGGLSFGLLDPSVDDAPPTLDGDDQSDGRVDADAPETATWFDVPYRVRQTSEPAAIEDPAWRERLRIPRERSADGEILRWWVVEKRQSDAATEEDRSAGRPQKLAEHQQWTVERAAALAERVGLPQEGARILKVAARLHDEGKRAARWQSAFNAPRGEGGEPYAKTRGPVNVRLLDGYRHEFGSLPHAERDPELLALSEEDRDLVLHLIASHHGFARPSISTKGCEDAPPSLLEERARQVALRFLRVQGRLGPWGLAWWEALLRAADQQASRENDRLDAGRGR